MAVFRTHPAYAKLADLFGLNLYGLTYYSSLFNAAGARTADSTSISAKSDVNAFGSLVYRPSSQGDTSPGDFALDLELKGSFSYGALGTVYGSVTTYSVSYRGEVVATVTGMSADAGDFWLSLLSAVDGDHVPIAFHGNDKLFGSSASDLMRGGGGDDLLKGFAGNDVLAGNLGNDTIRGGLGIDSINGGKGQDTIHGDMGNDHIWGGEGRDTLNGGFGLDELEGGAGNDTLRGGGGKDIFVFSVQQSSDVGEDKILDWRAGEGIQIRGLPDPSLVTVVQAGEDTVIYYLTNAITVVGASSEAVAEWIIA